MANEAGHIQITEFNKEVIPQINWMMEDLFCQYGVNMPWFMLDYAFPDYSQRPDWCSGYNFNLSWGDWGYWLPWFNNLINILCDEAGINKWQLPDMSSWDAFNSWISQLYENAPAAEVTTFGKTDIGEDADDLSAEEACIGCKFESTAAGNLASIKAYLLNDSDVDSVDVICGIYDSDGNLLTNGATGIETLAASYEGWKTFTFSTAPTVAASTTYWLVIKSDYYAMDTRYCYDTGETNQAADMFEYQGDTLPDPFVPDYPWDGEISIYATYQ